MKQGRNFWALVVVLVLAGVVVNFWEVAGEARVERRPLVEFPAEFAGWSRRGPDARFDAATEAVLRADDYVTRDYTDARGQLASFYVGYYGTQRTGATYHSPLNCLPGSGWMLDEPTTVEIKPSGRPAFEANQYIIRNGTQSMLLIYWYQGRGRAVASEYWDKVYTVIDSVRLRRSDAAMVRVLVPVARSEQEAAETAKRFAADAAPHLSLYVPD
jgi:EpsI family protein